VGTPMHFIRLAGCSVGKLLRRAQIDDPPGTKLHEEVAAGPIPILQTGAPAWICHTYDGRPFWCDTDFNKYEDVGIDTLISDTHEEHICITGGEPLIHWNKGLLELIKHANSFRKMVHIETSGTILPAELANGRGMGDRHVWISVSPKVGVNPNMLNLADEIKLLVDSEFKIENLPVGLVESHRVYLQPINNENSLNLDNIQLCMKLLEEYPQWKLSVQLHKVLGLR
jgi:7-carboxy-7-deazaguanine synthase